MILKRIGVLSLGIVSGAIYAILGLIFGGIFSLISIFTITFSKSPAILAFIFGTGAVIFLPIIYGLMGFLFGMLTAAIYNLIAGWTGGLELEFESTDKQIQ